MVVGLVTGLHMLYLAYKAIIAWKPNKKVFKVMAVVGFVGLVACFVAPTVLFVVYACNPLSPTIAASAIFFMVLTYWGSTGNKSLKI